MKNDKFLVELLDHLSNRPLLFFLGWGIIVAFFLYLFMSLQKNKTRRYFKDEVPSARKKSTSVQVVESEKGTDLTKEE